jgi:uncharacterized protein (UPF0262 family)
MLKFDRTSFRIQTFEEAAHQRTYWMSKSPAERLASAWFLICAAYNLDYRVSHKIDRTVFSMRKNNVEDAE